MTLAQRSSDQYFVLVRRLRYSGRMVRFIGDPDRVRFVADLPNYLGRGGPHLHDVAVLDTLVRRAWPKVREGGWTGHTGRRIRAVVNFCLFVPPAFAAEPIQPQGNVPSPPVPAFNRLNTYEQIVDALKGYASAYPKWTRLESIGKSIQGRDLWLLTINNPKTGPELSKPYRGLRDGSHILHLALPHVRYLDRHGQPTAQALERAREILRRLYCLAR